MMRMNLSAKCVVFASISAGCLVAATGASAFVGPEEGDAQKVSIKTKTLPLLTYKPAGKAYSADGVSRQYDKLSNGLRYLSGSRIFGIDVKGQSTTAFEQAALNAIATHKEVFGIDAESARINSKATLVSGDDAAVSFHVYRDGLRIQDAGITFHFKKGSLILVKNESYAEAALEPTLDGDSGEVAAMAVGSSGYIGRGSKYRVKPTNAGYSLVKVDEYIVAGEEEAYVVQVDRTNGKVFDLRTKNFNLRGSAVAKIYPRYFGESVSNFGLGFVGVQNSSARSNERGEFSTSDDFTAPALRGFTGQFVKVSNVSGDNLSATGTKVNGQWLIQFAPEVNHQVPWDNADMAQAMVYVNVNKIVNEAKKYVNPSWFNTALKANVNHSRHCNAFWDGDSINFFSAGDHLGKTCANTGIISDVTFHEWGHGLDDNTGGIDDSALSEGFGDAVSVYMTGDPQIGVEFLPTLHKPVRNLSELRVYPKDIVNEPHKDGIIVAGAWYDLYKALVTKHGATEGRNIMGKFLFKGIYQFAEMSDVYEATVALDDNNGNLTDKTPNFCLINNAFTRHGLATADSACR